eukprot:8724851-Karenia_brevis.AAC.1
MLDDGEKLKLADDLFSQPGVFKDMEAFHSALANPNTPKTGNPSPATNATPANKSMVMASGAAGVGNIIDNDEFEDLDADDIFMGFDDATDTPTRGGKGAGRGAARGGGRGRGRGDVSKS